MSLASRICTLTRGKNIILSKYVIALSWGCSIVRIVEVALQSIKKPQMII